MMFPMMQEATGYREITSSFGGYNHNLSCREGEFYDMENMSSLCYPYLSPRKQRGAVRKMNRPQGILDKEDLMWVDDGKFFINGAETELPGVELSADGEKTMAKMGAYVVIMPDKVWYNAEKNEAGYMERTVEIAKGTEIKMSLCQANGAAITWHDAEYYEENEPKDGDYMMSSNQGKDSLKVYSGVTAIWMPVTTTYLQITADGIGKGFQKEDGVKLTMDAGEEALSNIFVNEEDDGKVSVTTCIIDRTDDCITITGILGQTLEITDKALKVERKVPDMAFICECNNRLWGCSEDGHELYCCKLGDVTNWNCFQGVATDAWAATVGSDGKFTGAVSYLGYPTFFKEDGLIKILPSASGGHQTKETKCRGVQKGSEKSLVILNEVLYYKSATCVCAYNGSLPQSVSSALGDVPYYHAVAGGLGDRYFISMRDAEENSHLFVFDTKNGIWVKEDFADAICFCTHQDDLYFLDRSDSWLKSVGGTLLFDEEDGGAENKVAWFAQSGPIGYSTPDRKYVSRLNLRITLDEGSEADFFLQYDSCGAWEHKFNMAGSGTRTFTIPVIPRRCDHFCYKIQGKGGCRVHSLTKTLEDGSDI